MKNRILQSLMLILLILLIGGCGEKKVKIGFCMDSFVQERWEKDRLYFEEKVKELGGTVIVETAQGDAQKQFEQAKNLIKSGVDVLVIIAANRDKSAQIIDYAHLAGVKVIAYDRLIRSAKVDYYISFDNINVGELQAGYLTKRKPTGNYAIISGPPEDNNSFMFKLGQMNILQPLIENGDIKIVYDVFAEEWNEAQGEKCMLQCLEKSGKNIDAVLVANDALARGVIKALKANELAGKVLISGQDAEKEAIQDIIAGLQTMTVYKPIKAIATTAAEAAVKLARDGTIENANLRVNNGKVMVPSILLPAMVVNKDNIKMTVIEDDYLIEKEVFGTNQSNPE